MFFRLEIFPIDSQLESMQIELMGIFFFHILYIRQMDTFSC